MNIRPQVFASEFSSEFEKILQREIANSDVLGKCRVSGVLVARGLVAVLLVACCKALRHALMAGSKHSWPVARKLESEKEEQFAEARHIEGPSLSQMKEAAN